MNKAETENKKALGRTLFLSGMELTEIAERISVSRQTVSTMPSANRCPVAVVCWA